MFTISAKIEPSKEAPPINAPSTKSCSKKLIAFMSVTLPPYKTSGTRLFVEMDCTTF